MHPTHANVPKQLQSLPHVSGHVHFTCESIHGREYKNIDVVNKARARALQWLAETNARDVHHPDPSRNRAITAVNLTKQRPQCYVTPLPQLQWLLLLLLLLHTAAILLSRHCCSLPNSMSPHPGSNGAPAAPAAAEAMMFAAAAGALAQTLACKGKAVGAAALAAGVAEVAAVGADVVVAAAFVAAEAVGETKAR